jgi:hypothetical protein
LQGWRGVPVPEEEIVKKSEREAKEALRQVAGRRGDLDNVIRVTKKGAGFEGNQGQAVPQGFGSGIKDLLSGIGKKKGGKP